MWLPPGASLSWWSSGTSRQGPVATPTCQRMCTTWRALPHNGWRAAARMRVSSSWLQEGCHAVDMLPTPVLSHVHICVSSSVTACLLSHGRYRCASAPLCRRPLVPALQAVLGRPPPAPARGQGLPRRAALPLRRRAAALFCTGSGHAGHTSGQHHSSTGEGQHLGRGLPGMTALLRCICCQGLLLLSIGACLFGVLECAHAQAIFAPSNMPCLGRSFESLQMRFSQHSCTTHRCAALAGGGSESSSVSQPDAAPLMRLLAPDAWAALSPSSCCCSPHWPPRLLLFVQSPVPEDWLEEKTMELMASWLVSGIDLFV